MTKSQQIKQMTDAELAAEINSLMSEMYRVYCKGCPESKYRCNDAILKYLESEVAE